MKEITYNLARGKLYLYLFLVVFHSLGLLYGCLCHCCCCICGIWKIAITFNPFTCMMNFSLSSYDIHLLKSLHWGAYLLVLFLKCLTLKKTLYKPGIQINNRIQWILVLFFFTSSNCWTIFNLEERKTHRPPTSCWRCISFVCGVIGRVIIVLTVVVISWLVILAVVIVLVVLWVLIPTLT